ncbi:MAG TPA: endo-1,4-beta-xylanase [Rhizomicrobium sp.]|jgi:endo-1,4-beta-xylanase
MLSRRAVLGPLAAAGAALALGDARLQAAVQSDDGGWTSLREAAAKRGILYGCAAASYQLRNDAFATLLGREAAILVPEYEMKRGVVEPQPGAYDFRGADALFTFAQRNELAMRGHPLVWHKRNPDWLEGEVLGTRKERLLTGYVDRLVSRYRGRMHSWDVVNEAIAPADGRPDNLRNSFWLKAFGPSYIDLAFTAARHADPAATLVYNDWGCEAGAPDNDRFRTATLDFLESALSRNVPIDALGLQGHLLAFGTQVDQRKLRDFLEAVKALGLRILITELDVDDSGGALDTGVRDRAVADASRRFLDVALDNSATVAVLTWGLSDRYLDSPGLRASLMGYSPRTLPYDSGFVRKPMWQAMGDAFASRYAAWR